MNPVVITTPLDRKAIGKLAAGDAVSISGDIFTARDAAHARLAQLAAGEDWPFNPVGALIYYAGPSPTPPGLPIGSAGPTTSSRMDPYMEMALTRGVLATMGKGERSESVRRLCERFGAVYLVTVGGAAALLARSVTANETVAFDDLGPEAIRRLAVRDFPALVAYDAAGGSIFDRVGDYAG
ncbi:MAG: fumarate hydratase C-terminal domain-containing protein [Planctomycetes bacterium]|nr:fumarate hydratase C-terminal domain-containing protein [Planctomycetota bacterium]